MDFFSNENSRDNWYPVRDIREPFGKPYSYSSAGGVSWIARRTWISALDKTTGRRGNRGPKKVKKHHIVNALTVLYISVLLSATIITAMTWK